MLIRFGVQNHRSIAAKQELSLSVSALRDDRTHLINHPAAPDGSLLPAIVIYGANASGKSNVVSALRAMRSMILHSHSRGEPGGPVPRNPFALDQQWAKAPSTFDADFIIDDVRYHYGFEATNDAFVAEWLYSFPNDRRQVLFDRKGMRVEFGRNLKGHNKVISDLMRTNSLFLSCGAQNGHNELSKVSGFFRSMNVHGTDISTSRFDEFATGDIDSRVISFLGATSTGVVTYSTQEVTPPEDIQKFTEEFRAVIAKHLGDQASDGIRDGTNPRRVIRLGHRNAAGDVTYLNLDQESAGTQRLLPLLSSAFRALDSNTTMIVDELDASLHTRACEAILAHFSSKDTNQHGAQLIATTHDTNLLRCPNLRRDQIWFVEKGPDGASHLYPLTDIRTRKGDNVERGYLQGRFGAVPFSGSVAELLSPH